MTKKVEKAEKQEVNPEGFFVVPSELANALMAYLQEKPYKESSQMVQQLGQVKNLKTFTAEFKLVD